MALGADRLARLLGKSENRKKQEVLAWARIEGNVPLKKDLAEFAVLVREGVDALRNVVNEPELLAWLEGIASERLGPVGSDAFDGAQPTQEAKAREWIAKVARKHQLREGASSEVGTSEASSLSSWSGLPWVRKALDEKRKLSCLLLPDVEREKIASVLDWMRSAEGPLVSGDWTRISFEQALKAEHNWIEAKAKAYAKKKDNEEAEEGTTLFVDLSSLGDKWGGWRWVRIESALALDREGALMKHCVGSYAKDVAEGRKEIYSLRDPEDKPRLTVEARGSTLAQLKGYANGPCPEELREATEAFVSEFEKRADPDGLGLVELSSDMERAGFAALPGVGVFKRDSGFSTEQRGRWERKLSNLADEKGKEQGMGYEKLVYLLAKLGMGKELCELLPLLDPGVKHSNALRYAASAGRKEIVEMLLPMSDPLAKNSQALCYAASAGHKEIVELLIPVSKPLENDSQALCYAAGAGHKEIVEMLLPVSNPLAKDSEALRCAASSGHKETVVLLLPVSNPLANDSQALRYAARGGHKEIVAMLMPVSNPLANDSVALRCAAEGGHKETVALLLPVCHPLADDSVALREAASAGHKEVVAMLLPVSDPLANDSVALREAVRMGHKEIVEILLPVSNPLAKDSEALRCAVSAGDKEIVKMLLPVSNPLANDSVALRHAASAGNKEIVAMLLPVSNPLAMDSTALRGAAVKGHKEIVKMLLPVSNPLAMDSEALSEAAKGGHKAVVEMLLLVSNPLANDSAALRYAAIAGHKEIVGLLLPVSNPLAKDSRALRYAASAGHKEIVEMLLPVSDPLAHDSAALREAASAGHKEVVRMLAPYYREDKETFHRLLKKSGMNSNDFNFSTLDDANVNPLSDLMVGKIKGRREKLASGVGRRDADEVHVSSSFP